MSRGKPAPDAFLLAAEKIGIAPEHCVGYEGTPQNESSGPHIVDTEHWPLARRGPLVASLFRMLVSSLPFFMLQAWEAGPKGAPLSQAAPGIHTSK